MSRDFSPFGLLHALVVVAAVVLWALLIRAAAARGSADRSRLVIPLAVSILVANLFWFFHRLEPERYSPSSSWPFQLCDLAWMVAAWSLLQHDRDDCPAHQLIFFWGLGLSSQAFLTPTLGRGPALPRFWFFWLAHWQIVAAGLLNLVVYGRRPTWRGFRLAATATVVCGLIMTAVNLRFDTPYFFTSAGEPENPTIIDQLGPWPLRLVWLGLLVLAWFAALRLLFGRRRAREGKGGVQG